MSKRILHFLGLILLDGLLLFLYILNNHIFTLMLVLIAFLFPIFSFFIEQNQKKEITLSVSADQSVLERNRHNCIHLNFQNKNWFPCAVCEVSIRIYNRFEPNDYLHEYRYYIKRNRTTVCDIPVTFTACGCYEITVTKVRIVDFLGLFSSELPSGQHLEILCMPQKIKITEDLDNLLGGSNEEEIYELDEKGDDYSEVKNIREYEPGDKLQTVHWKLSAKEQAIMIKEFGSLSGDVFQVYLEEEYKDLRQIDAYYDLLFSMLLYLSERDIHYSVCFPEGAKEDSFEKLEIKEKSEIDDIIIRSFYSEKKERSGGPFEGFLKNSPVSNLLVITTRAHNGSGYTQLYNYKNYARVYQYRKEK